MSKKVNEKFQFSTDYQLDLLKFTAQDREGYRALELYEDSYFSLLEHAVIAFTFKNFYKKKRRVPGASILKEELQLVFRRREFVTELSEEDRTTITSIADSLYVGELRDGDEILDRCAKWASYVELKAEIENVNLLDFASHESFSTRISRAINKGDSQRDRPGTFLIKDILTRQFKRQDDSPIVPTPWKQINKLTNAGGYPKGSIVVFLDKPKSLKTYTLMNVVLGYARKRKRIFVADLENGEDELSLRLEQSISNHDKRDVLSGEFDKAIQKVLKRYGKLGIEIYIKRFPAGSTSADLQAEMDWAYREHGIRFEVAIIDYIGLMGSLRPTDDETERINRAYLDVGNLALKNGLDIVYSANHIKRDAEKRTSTKYVDTDIAKCMDIVRHAQAIFGLNRNETDMAKGILRMELVVQRDGVPYGRALFHSDPGTQRMVEFTAQERKEYDRLYNDGNGEEASPTDKLKSSRFKGDVE